MRMLETEVRPEMAALREGPVVVRAHHYDAALHRAITETGKVDGRATLERAAASAAYRSMTHRRGILPPAQGLAELIRSCGLGTMTSGEWVEGLPVWFTLDPSPYASARREMFGTGAEPACDVTRGVVGGALGALTGTRYQVKELECVAAGGDRCRFVAEPVVSETTFEEIPAFEWPARGAVPHPEAAFISAADLAPLLKGDGGPAGATYGRLWAELYARAAHDFEQEIPAAMGAKFANLASVVLTEAAHLGTFYSIGGLLRSPEWSHVVASHSSAREDWVHAIVTMFNGFGWGDWRVKLLAPEQRFTVHVQDGHEALSHVALAGSASSPRCYFSRGVVAALMNLLYAGDIHAPETLNQSVYNSLFRSPLSFRAIETRCQAMGDTHCEFVANPLSPGLRAR